MSARIESYALLGDTRTAALVGLDGSIDWLCLPRFESPAAFAALVGTPENGHWRIAPANEPTAVTRAYVTDTLVLETTFAVGAARVRLRDAMLLDGERPRVMRVVRGLAGTVAMRMTYVVRFDYGSIVPWVRRTDRGLLAVAGPDALLLASDVETRADGMTTVAEFAVRAGERIAFELAYFPSHEAWPDARAPVGALDATIRTWRGWARACTDRGPYRETIVRSLLTLKALTFAPTGGIVAAPTMGLPERIGGERNWDYRYCWLRDATFTLYALLAAGHVDAARDWRNWLARAVAGRPGDLQIVYSIRGARRLAETTLPWLGGYEGSTPVRLGNAAHDQFQLDVYGEVVDLLYASHRFGIERSGDEWELSKAMLVTVRARWREPDRGLWEVRGERQHFVHSKAMAWVAFDRAVRAVEEFGLDGPVEGWRAERDAIFADICERGYDAERGTFVRAYGSRELDASLLLLPIVGFLPPEDPRIVGTLAALESTLLRDGLVLRYESRDADDGLPPGEGAFLACSFWLVDNYVLAGRLADARALYERLVALANDVGLLAEEYDPVQRRQLGNFPQAFSHVGLINSGMNLSHAMKPAHERANRGRSRTPRAGS